MADAIHHIRWAEEPVAFVVANGGERQPFPFAEAKRFAVGGGAATENVDYLEIGYPAALLKERILLVDTPGVNDLSLARADITYSYIPRADAVLFLLDAGQILKESERVFLNDKLLKASRDKIVFVITLEPPPPRTSRAKRSPTRSSTCRRWSRTPSCFRSAASSRSRAAAPRADCRRSSRT